MPTRPANPDSTPAPGRDARLSDPQADDRADLALITAIRAGDANAWRRLLEGHQQRLFAICLRMTSPREAADVCQDAMVRIIAGLAQFDGRSQFLTWATRVTMNVCLTHLRKERLRRHASLDAMTEGRGVREKIGSDHSLADQGNESQDFDRAGSSMEPDAASRVQSSSDSRLVALGLERLEPEQRAMLVLRDVRAMDYSHIAQALGIAEGTVKSRIFRARAALREIVEQLTKSAAADD